MNPLDRDAGEWRARADDLAAWVMAHLVNRTDVWGRYVRNKSEATTGSVSMSGAADQVVSPRTEFSRSRSTGRSG